MDEFFPNWTLYWMTLNIVQQSFEPVLIKYLDDF